MKTIFFILTSIYLCLELGAQNPLSYLFSEQIEMELKNNPKESKFQNAAWRYCEIGQYKKAKLKLEAAPNQKQIELTGSDSNLLSVQNIYNARPALLKYAKDKQIVIINEDPSDPRHRAFAESLLLEFYNNGFRYLAIESLQQNEKEINKRKYPILKSGKYANEPQMGNLIRTAISIGFKIVACAQKKEKTNAKQSMNKAKIIAKVLKKDAKAKLLVLCEPASLYENNTDGLDKTMTTNLKEMTGLDPFTINQVKYVDGSSREVSNAVLRKLILFESSILINDQGQFFTTLDQNKQWDVSLLHSFPKYVFDRPAWITSGVARLFKEMPNKPEEISYPYLVLAYLENEFVNKDAVPVDVIEIENETDKKQMALYLGNYQLVMQDKTGKAVTQKFVVAYQQP